MIMEVSLSLFDKEHTGREKYIYFICSVAGALVAYLGKDYVPHNPWTLHDTLTIATLSCLVLSFVFGIARILTYIHGLSTNREAVVAVEGIKNVNKSLLHHKENEGKGVPITMGEGEPITVEQLKAEMKMLVQQKNDKMKQMKTWYNVSTVLFVICHVFLIAGFVLLVCSKLPNTGIIPHEVSSTSTHLSAPTNLRSAFVPDTQLPPQTNSE